jgi:hypothetical protein
MQLLSSQPFVASLALACAGLWGFDDLTVGDAGSVSGADAATPGDASGTESGPTVQCDGGLTSCGGACVDTQGDGKNCGACGHDCQGGVCQTGACQPVMLASGQAAPLDIAVDGMNVYWTNMGHSAGSGTVSKVPVGGGSVTTLASGQSSPYGIAIDATSVYWTKNSNPGNVMKVPSVAAARRPSRRRARLGISTSLSTRRACTGPRRSAPTPS